MLIYATADEIDWQKRNFFLTWPQTRRVKYIFHIILKCCCVFGDVLCFKIHPPIRTIKNCTWIHAHPIPNLSHLWCKTHITPAHILHEAPIHTHTLHSAKHLLEISPSDFIKLQTQCYQMMPTVIENIDCMRFEYYIIATTFLHAIHAADCETILYWNIARERERFECKLQ